MRRHGAALAIGLFGFSNVIAMTEERPIYRFPLEIRKRNYVRLSTETCDECMTLEDFYKSNPLGFVLFFERALMGGHKYKDAIVRGWIETCQELRWSRIACGMVDMVSDRSYAARYIDPKTAPAHIVVHKGEPVMALKEQVDLLLKKPGDKATMLAHVGDLLKDEGSLGKLTLSAVATNREGVRQLVQRHRVAIVAFPGDDKRLADVFRAGVQEAVLAHGMLTQVEGKPDEDRGQRKGKGNKAQEKRRVAFVAAHGKGMAEHFGVKQGSIAAFVDGAVQPGAVMMKPDAKLGDAEVLEAIKQVHQQLAGPSVQMPIQDSAQDDAKRRKRKSKKGDSEL